MPLLENIKFIISREDVYRLLKFARAKTESNSKIEKLIENGINEGYALAEPRAVYETYTISEADKERIFLGERYFSIKSKDVAERLKGSAKLSIFACTIGRALSEKVNEYAKKKETVKAAILDAVGSEAVEGVANSINGIIAAAAHVQGCKVLPRFSPGYGDWEIEAQKDLLELLGTEQIGITLSAGLTMIPEKSITAVVGWEACPVGDKLEISKTVALITN